MSCHVFRTSCHVMFKQVLTRPSGKGSSLLAISAGLRNVRLSERFSFKADEHIGTPEQVI